jgi:regulator of sigma E protease
MPEIEALNDYFAFSFVNRIVFSFAGPLANIIAAWIGLLVLSVINNGFGLESLFIWPVAALWGMIVQILQSIPMLFQNPKQFSGIVGLVAVGGQQVGVDIMKILSLSILLNINLAILNLLPILPLDGGKIVLDVLQRLRMPVQKLYVPVALAGWLLLLGFMVYVTINDVTKLMA